MPITCPISFKPLSTEDFGQMDYSVMASAFATHKEFGRLADEVIYQSDFAARLSQAEFKISREGTRPGNPFLPGSIVLGPVNSGLWAFSGEVSYERTRAGLA